jgi:hypothetical protein
MHSLNFKDKIFENGGVKTNIQPCIKHSHFSISYPGMIFTLKLQPLGD